MKKKNIVTALTLAALLSFSSVTVFAAGQETEAPAATGAADTSAYSYIGGQQRSQSRNAVYGEAEKLESEEAQEAFLKEREIGETEWSEEAAASYSYVGGQQRGASFRTDSANDNENADMGSYSYVAGQQRGSSYHQ